VEGSGSFNPPCKKVVFFRRMIYLPKKEIGIQKNKKTPFGLKVSVI
jgi:hypothetical protein